MITLSDYAGDRADSADWTAVVRSNASVLLIAVANLMAYMQMAGILFMNDPATGTPVSQGFLLQKESGFWTYKEGLSINLYDPDSEIDNWLIEHQTKLEANGLFLEHPEHTPNYSHWTTSSAFGDSLIFKKE